MMLQNPTRVSVITAITLVLYSLLFMLILPGWVGGMVDLLDFTYQEAAIATSAQMGGASVGTLFVYLTVKSLNFRRYVFAALCTMILGDVCVALLQDKIMFFIALVIRGFGSGVLAIALLIFIAKDPEKEKFYGVIFGFQFFIAAAGIYLMPTLFAVIDWSGIFLMTASVGVILLATGGVFPSNNKLSNNSSSFTNRDGNELLNLISIPVLLCLTSYLLHFIANSAIWTFLDRIGANLQFNHQEVASALAISMVAGGLFALIPIIIGIRFGRSIPLVSGIIAVIISSAMLIGHMPYWEFVFAASLFNGALSMTIPYYQGLLADLETSGRVLIMGTIVSYGGFVLGPIFGATMESLYAFDGMLIAAIGLFIICMLMVAPITFRFDKSFL